MTDLGFSAKTPINNQQEKFPLTPQPVYPKFKPSVSANNLSNISTEYSMKEDSRILCSKNHSNSGDENSADIENLAKPKPLAFKKSSFSLCKNFLLGKNFEEIKINEIGIFSSLRIKTKNPNLANFSLNSNSNKTDVSKEQDENENQNNSKNHANQENIDSIFAHAKRSSLFAANLNKSENAENKNENANDEIFNNLNALNNFSLNQINNKIENLKVNNNAQSNSDNNNFNNNDKNHFKIENINFQNFESQIFPSCNVKNYKNNHKYYDAPVDYSNAKSAELKLLKHKNLSYSGHVYTNNSDFENENCKKKSTLFQKRLLEESYDEVSNFNSDSQILNKPSCFRKISDNTKNRIDGPMSNLGFGTHSGLNKFYENEKEKEKYFNINNITNIYINFENGNNHIHSNFKALNPCHDDIFNRSSNNLSYLPYIKNSNNNNSSSLFSNKIRNDFVSKSLNTSPNFDCFNYLNQNNFNNTTHLDKASERLVCSNTGVFGIPISDKFQRERMFRKIFNLCDLSICRKKVNKITNNLFDIYNIELVEPLYKNNFRGLTVEKKSRNAKKFSLDTNEYMNSNQTEESILHEIKIRINGLFNELLDIQKKYLTKASGYISKKQVLTCENFISQINSLSKNLIKMNPRAYQFSEDQAVESDSCSEADNEYLTSFNQHNKKFSNFKLTENDDILVSSNDCSSILNNNLSNFKDEISLNHFKLNSKRNKIIINNSESTNNYLGASNIGENDNFSSNLELNDLNQMDITNNYSDLKPEKKRKNSAYMVKNEKILQRKISKAASETYSINNNSDNKNLTIKMQKENFSEDSFDSDLNKECFSSLENSRESQNNSKSGSKAAKSKCASKSKKLNDNRKSSKNESSSLNNENKEIYKCDYCDAFYYTGQALGGHMSRTHPNLSVKYKMKKIVRDRRENQRNVLTEARRELLSKYNLDYEDMKNDKIKKHILKSFIKEHSFEYKEIVKKQKKTKKAHK